MSWHDLIDFEDTYEICDEYPYTIRKKSNGFELKESINQRGYYSVSLNRRPYTKHRLIAKQFIPNPDNLPFVDHMNRDKTDNHVFNLRWTTNAENQKKNAKSKKNPQRSTKGQPKDRSKKRRAKGGSTPQNGNPTKQPTGGQNPQNGGQTPPTGGQNQQPTGGQNQQTGNPAQPTGGSTPQPTGGQTPPTGSGTGSSNSGSIFANSVTNKLEKGNDKFNQTVAMKDDSNSVLAIAAGSKQLAILF